MFIVLMSGVAGAQDPLLGDATFSEEINYVGDLEGIEGGPVIIGEEGELRCLADQFSVPSQGFHVSGSGVHVSGSVGGLVLGEIEILDESGEPDPNLNPTPVAVSDAWQATGARAWLAGLQPRDGTDVIILIVDDFGGGKFKVPAAAFALQPGDEAELIALVDSGELSHGALVMHHLNALLSASEAFGLDEMSSDPDDGHVVWMFRDQTSSRLIVEAVDLHDSSSAAIDTEMIVATIRSNVDRLSGVVSSEQLETHFVINMSWVLLPCPTVEQFKNLNADFATFEQYLEGLEVPSDINGTLGQGADYVKNVLRVLSFVNPDDPLLAAISDSNTTVPGDVFLLKRDFGAGRIALVAATGNFGMEYQMLPAAWPMVVGAGAPDEPEPPFSNLAEVSAPGAWFRLEPLDGIDAPLPAGVASEVSYAGTSFSAPMVSLLTAIDIATVDLCTPVDFRTTDPGLRSDPPGDVAVVQGLKDCGNQP